MAEKRKAFAGKSAGEARVYASDWLMNFRDHGPLDIRSIRVAEDGAYFVATVTYAEMSIEAAPRYFENYEPALLRSA